MCGRRPGQTHEITDQVCTRELAQNQTSYRYTVAAVALGLQGITQVVPGLVHIFKDDGGANSIAGIALGQCETEVLVLFTALGKVQIMFGCCLLFVLLLTWRTCVVSSGTPRSASHSTIFTCPPSAAQWAGPQP